MPISTDATWMNRALELAQRAKQEGEVPVGAIIVKDDQCIAEAWNRPIAMQDPSAHAEILALRAAAQRLRNYRLPGTTVYVTLEPCVMCAGALIQARVARVVYGCSDPKAGAAGSVFSILGTEQLNHKIKLTGGVQALEASTLLTDFFRPRRG